METITTTQKELIDLILRLTDLDYESFCMNYNIKDTGRNLLEFILDLDEETTEEVINEIHINTNLTY
jgi:hypothetical protein